MWPILTWNTMLSVAGIISQFTMDLERMLQSPRSTAVAQFHRLLCPPVTNLLFSLHRTGWSGSQDSDSNSTSFLRKVSFSYYFYLYFSFKCWCEHYFEDKGQNDINLIIVIYKEHIQILITTGYWTMLFSKFGDNCYLKSCKCIWWKSDMLCLSECIERLSFVEKAVCVFGQKSCDNGHCIMSEWFCDGDKDCPNGEDEKNCGKRDFAC